MSTSAGTIQGTKVGVSWAGARIAAILLTIVLAVTLFAMTRGSSSADTVPAGARYEQLSRDGSVKIGTSDTLPVRQPITIGDNVCQQCR